MPLAAASSLPLEKQAQLDDLVSTGTELTRNAYGSDFAHLADWCDATAERTGSHAAEVIEVLGQP